MNKPSIKLIRLNDGDVISTSGGYWVMGNWGNNNKSDNSFTSPDGNVYGISDFSKPNGALAYEKFVENAYGYVLNGYDFYDQAQVDPGDRPFLTSLNGNWTFDSSTRKFIQQ